MRLLLVLLVAAGAGAQQNNRSNPYTTPADIAAGAKAFRAHCAECHGSKGEGGRGPTLATGIFFHGSTDADLFQNISNGIPGTAMPAAFYPPEGIWQIVAYIRSASSGSSSQQPPGDAARGAALFREKACLSCHLIGGEGGAQGPDLSYIGSQRSIENLRQSILDPNAVIPLEYRVARLTTTGGAAFSGFLLNADTYSVQINDFSQGLKSFQRRELRSFEIDKNSSMPSYKDKLNENELNDLLAYLWTLRRQRRSQ